MNKRYIAFRLREHAEVLDHVPSIVAILAATTTYLVVGTVVSLATRPKAAVARWAASKLEVKRATPTTSHQTHKDPPSRKARHQY